MNKFEINLFSQELIIFILITIIICGSIFSYLYIQKQQKILMDLKRIKLITLSQGDSIKTNFFNSNLQLETKFSSKEIKFLNNTIIIVENNIADSGFGVENLAEKVGFSTSQLNRKIKAITNQTTIQFIRSIKLQKAYEMLRADTDNIAGIAYSTGFESPGYFTKVFKEHFGFLPSDKEKMNKKVNYSSSQTET